MPEGVLSSGGQLAEPTFDDPKVQPPEDVKAAPLGWTWSRQERRWRPKKVAGRGGNKNGPRPIAEPEPASESQGSDRDPDPGWFADDTKPGSSGSEKRPFDIGDVPRQVREDLAGALGFMGMAVLPVVESIDPYCGRAISDNFQRIAEACVPLLCRSERVIKFMTSTGGGFMDYVALGLALAPVGKAIAEHHIFRTVQVVRDEHGRVNVVKREASGPVHGDHLTPPMPHMQYAA